MGAEAGLQGWRGQDGAGERRPPRTLTLTLQGHECRYLDIFFLSEEPCEVGLAVANTPLLERH